MSSIGRPSATIDLNKTTLSAVSLLNEQLEQAELDIDALELRTTDLESRSTVLEDNLGLPSLQEIYDDTNNLIQEQRNATGLNLKVETNETHISTNTGNISTNTEAWQAKSVRLYLYEQFENHHWWGSLSSFAFSTALTNFSPTTEPMLPPKNEKSRTIIITGIPLIDALPETAASFKLELS